MFLGIIGAVMGSTAVPLAAVGAPVSAVATSTSVVGLSQGMGQQSPESASGGGKAPDPADDPRLAKFTLRTSCDAKSSVKDEVDNKQVVLYNGKLYLDQLDPARRHFRDGHPFSGFYLEYPSGQKPAPMGLVSTIRPDPPELNWIYVDKKTLELKYGNKTQSIPHIFAPWDWTEDKEGVTLDGWEGFVALEESSGVWVLCYDQNDNHLKNVRKGRRVLECGLERVLNKQ